MDIPGKPIRQSLRVRTMTTLDQNNPGNRTANTDTTAKDLKSASADISASNKQKTKQHLEENRTSAASEIHKVTHATRAASQDLREQEPTGRSSKGHSTESLSTEVAELADNVSSFAQSLRHKSVDELTREAEQIARNNPALFIGGSIAIGLGIARFAKASSHRAWEQQQSPSMTNHSTARPDINSGNSSTLAGTST